MRSYEVHVIPVQPACTDRGYFLDVHARNKKEAISAARKRVHVECLYGRPDGALRFTAKEF